jgi:FkbM family methyltransferase
MSFVSYAQNFEDVMLWRALKHIERGFYIDIGAQDPVIDSVSLAFYERGWRGVHVEPTVQYANTLRQERPDETVQQVAIGNHQGFVTLYEFGNTGLSTIFPNIAQKWKLKGLSCIESTVPILSLDALFERIGQPVIHWLKVDVEGSEKSVLESWKESKARPWILVIECTEPCSQEETYIQWEDLVLSKGYQFAYFDGLNRFYVFHVC